MLYKLIHNLKYKVLRLVSIIHTKYRLIGNDVKCENYRIVGVPFFHVTGEGRVVFGNNLQMNNGITAGEIGYKTPCVFRAEGASIIIGKNVGMTQVTLVAKEEEITIGDNVKLGRGVKVFTTDFHSLDYLKRRNAKEDFNDRKCKPVTIGDDCFIGAGTFILKGVTIGPRTIVGAGSVVTKNIPADCIAAGNPCKVIKLINQ